jgi:hypothetical protein
MNAHHHITGAHHESADHNRFLVTEVAIGNQTANERRQEDQRDKCSVQIGCFLFGHRKTGLDVFEVKRKDADH